MSPVTPDGETDEVDATDNTETGGAAAVDVAAEPPAEPDPAGGDAREEAGRDVKPADTDPHIAPDVVEAEVVEAEVVGSVVTDEETSGAKVASTTAEPSATAEPVSPTDDSAAIEPEIVAPEAPAVDALVAQIADLQARLEDVEADAEAFRDQLYRKAADLENTKRRLGKQMESVKRFGTEEVLKAFLPIVDDLERALEHAKKSDESAADDESSPLGSFVEGTEMVLRKLHGALERFGVVKFESVGEPFDPQRHEALSQMESLEHPDGAVILEYQTGYFHHDRLMRPALVVVGRNPEERAARRAAEAERAAAEAAEDERAAAEAAEDERAAAEADSADTDEVAVDAAAPAVAPEPEETAVSDDGAEEDTAT